MRAEERESEKRKIFIFLYMCHLYLFKQSFFYWNHKTLGPYLNKNIKFNKQVNSQDWIIINEIKKIIKLTKT